jgi:hypothetical protein
MIEKRRVGGCVLRAMAVDGFDIASVSYHGRVLF